MPSGGSGVDLGHAGAGRRPRSRPGCPRSPAPDEAVPSPLPSGGVDAAGPRRHPRPRPVPPCGVLRCALGCAPSGECAAPGGSRIRPHRTRPDPSTSARGTLQVRPLVFHLVPTSAGSARSPGNPRGRLPEVRPRGLPGDLAGRGAFSRTGQRPWRPFPMQRRGPRGSSLPGGLGTAPRARCVTGYGFPIGIHPGARQCPQRTRRPVPRS